MRVLFVASELHPTAKVSGLGDVIGALPRALGGLGIEVRCLIPGYPSVLDGLDGTTAVADLPDLFGGDARLLEGTAGGITVLAIDAPHLYLRDGGPYLDPTGADWLDNDRRFAALGWAALAISSGEAGAFQPDIVHAHDWQGGLAPAYLALHGDGTGGGGSGRPKTVLTVHNVVYQGLFPAERLHDLRLPEASFGIDGVEFHGRIGFLKAGLAYADRITTVSPSHARELRTPACGCGLDGLFEARARDLTGILNGIDMSLWDPATDTLIAAPFDAATPDGKAANKCALQEELGLEPRPDRALLAVVSRLTPEKGLDLVLDAADRLLSRGAQLAVLGVGDPDLERRFAALAAAAPAQAAAVFRFDEALAHRLQAGADGLLVPSRSESGGLTALCGLRYGTIPIVARRGGLADVIVDANTAALEDGVATGFLVEPLTADTLVATVERALDLFARPDLWRTVRQRAMSRDHSWARPARRYAELYLELLQPARGAFDRGRSFRG